MTRGAIYGHFKSKEHMVDAVTTYMFNRAVPVVQIIEQKDIKALDKIKQLFIASLASEEQLKVSMAISKRFYDNPKIVAAYMKSIVDNVVNMLMSLICEGQKDGSIKVTDPEIIAELLSVVMNIWLSPMIFSDTQSKFEIKLTYASKILENIGLPIIDKDVEQSFKNLLAALPK